MGVVRSVLCYRPLGGTMEREKTKLEETIRQLREELGAIRSCGLIMAHAQAADARTRYLKTLNEKAASMELLLAKLLKEASP